MMPRQPPCRDDHGDGVAEITTTGDSLLVDVVPMPSCPTVLSPQHRTRVSAPSAQVKAPPVEIATAPVTPGTLAGRATPASLVVPLPSWPEPLLPQQLTVPSLCKAQPCVMPIAMDVTPVSPLSMGM